MFTRNCVLVNLQVRVRNSGSSYILKCTTSGSLYILKYGLSTIPSITPSCLYSSSDFGIILYTQVHNIRITLYTQVRIVNHLQCHALMLILKLRFRDHPYILKCTPSRSLYILKSSRNYSCYLDQRKRTYSFLPGSLQERAEMPCARRGYRALSR